ncbi:MFS transporter [Rhodococcus sp. 14-2496-1d]|uniref:MFS transporter n=1 Tax=Rhodococcus sp. 14-2496-1d TaxID=2023146 RepID=UPI000B9B9BB2|nr:MFS transporter [Rhodococcus sp. 14-2496-1d]OZF25699.1 MFS transporter [Rhodococcus sp. 14-2496-1d]
MAEHSLDGIDGPRKAVAHTDPRRMKRIAFASFIGTLVEFYDFVIYSTAAALVFPQVFFPALGAAAGTVASFATFGVAFVARPFGSILFGHFGDRLGRKKTLIATLLLMGIATGLVGLMPTADKIGVIAPIMIVLLRVLQGLAAGGEWAGAVLFASENSPKAKRGVWAAVPLLGACAAIILANATFLVSGLSMTNETFVSWGWRIPFLASIVLVGIGLWVRLTIEETAVFKTQVARHGTLKLPFLEAFKKQPRILLLAAGTEVTAFTLSYVAGPYMTSYGTAVLGLSRNYVLTIAIVGGVCLFAATFFGAWISDRIGRRRTIIIAVSTGIVWSLVLFPILETKSRVAFALAVPLTLMIAGMANGPVGAYVSELFHTRYRYTAAGFSYSLAGILGGAVPPLVGAYLTARFELGGIIFGVFVAGLCLLSLLCVLALTETKAQSLTELDAAYRDADVGTKVDDEVEVR